MLKLYKASAGSGKTFTLVKEYLKLVLKPTSELTFRRILATTFTNKAANEMKARVLEALAFLSDPEPLSSKHDILKGVLLEELGFTTEELQQKSHRILRAILHNYADFGIGTIDRFTHRIVRTFARDLNLPVNFEIELDNKPLIKQAIDLMLSKIGDDPELSTFLVQFTLSKVDNGEKYDLEFDIQSIAEELLKEDGVNAIKALKSFSLVDFQQKIDRYKELNDQFLDQIQPLGEEATKLIKGSGANADSFFQGGRGIYAYFHYLSELRTEKFSPNNHVRTTIEDDKWYSGKIKKDLEQQAAIDDIKKELESLYNQAKKLIDNGYQSYRAREVQLKNLYAVALINELDKIIGELRITENKVHISEFNKRISDVIAKEPAPFIYERIGDRYHHYMVDEFQDTSIMQFHNLIPLFTNALSQGYFSMLVGDAKQAIYRFRGGEVEQFVALPRIYKSEENPTVASSQALFEQLVVRDKTLNRNFRSKEEIVNFNTSFFEYCYQKYDDIKSLYEGHSQTPKEKNRGGYVEVHFCEKPLKNYDTEEEDDDPEQIEVIVDRIERCLQQGYQLRDIVLLFRGNTKANEVAKILIDKGYKIASAESVMIANSAAVTLIVNVLYALIYPSEVIYKKYIVDALFTKGHFKGESLDEVYTRILSKNHTTSFWEDMGFTAEQLPFNALRKRPLFELIETTFRAFGLLHQSDPYIQFFMDEVFDYTLSNNNDILGFLTWWEQRKDSKSITLPEGIDALNIMTIHKSKGLEFPVVIMPYATERLKIGGGKWVVDSKAELPIDQLAYIQLSSGLEETKYKSIYLEEKRNATIDLFNTLYVGFTRAEDRLYIISNLPSKSSSTLNLSTLMMEYLASKGEWNTEEKTFVLSGKEITKTSPHVKDAANVEELLTFISKDWNNKLALSYQAPDYWDINFGEDARQYGNTIHLILALIKTKEDISRVFDKLHKQGNITSEQHAKYAQEIALMIDQPAFAPYFKDGLKVKTECDLLTPDGKTLRPDRVVYFEDTVKVIDFKTGKPLEKHKEQLKTYIELLQKVEDKPVSGSLIYIGELEEVVV
jgi:ATP-dependent exoDNAse (exonuclease V) beta subunit